MASLASGALRSGQDIWLVRIEPLVGLILLYSAFYPWRLEQGGDRISGEEFAIPDVACEHRI